MEREMTEREREMEREIREREKENLRIFFHVPPL